MRPKANVFAALTTLILVFVGAPLQGQQTIARSYSIVPMDGMSVQFEAALKQHMEWRVANGDPWTWGVSALEVGEGLGEYGVRSGGHTWADLDEYDATFGQAALQHYMATVAPLVKSVSSTISSTNEANSNRPPQGRALAFVTITRFHIRPGQQAEFQAGVAAATQALKGTDWPGYWVWADPMSGGGMGPYAELVALHDSWADMEEPDPPLLAVLAQAMGQDEMQAWLTSFTGSIRGEETTVRRLRPDLDGR
jgi:hypothetical protein